MKYRYTELETLEKELGLSSRFLYSLSNSIYDQYHSVTIPKKSGGERRLYIPSEKLKLAQSKIANLLDALYFPSENAHAYIKGKSHVTNASLHVGHKELLKLDIYGFFDHVSFKDVREKVFVKDLFSDKISILLSILTTLDSKLPQGAPSSPVISNIVLSDFDEVISSFCKDNNITYTRYCDDLTFSSDKLDTNSIIGLVKHELVNNGLRLNDKKIVYVKDGQRKEVTGVVVNEKINAPIKYRKTIRQTLYYIKKYGYFDYLEKSNISEDPIKYATRLLGRINYVISLNGSEEFKEYMSYLTEQLPTIKNETLEKKKQDHVNLQKQLIHDILIINDISEDYIDGIFDLIDENDKVLNDLNRWATYHYIHRISITKDDVDQVVKNIIDYHKNNS